MVSWYVYASEKASDGSTKYVITMISFIKFSTFCFNYTVQDIHVIIIQSESINLFNLHLSLIILPPQVLDYFPINNYQFHAK